MFKYSRDGVSVLTILDTRRAKKSGLFPVKVQVVFGENKNITQPERNCRKKTGKGCLKQKPIIDRNTN